MKHAVEFALVVGLAVISSLLIYVYYDELASFFLDANPVYRGLAIFSLCFISTSSIIFPIPYTAAILSLTARIPEINLLEIALWGGLGSGLGEVVGWILGLYFRRQVEDSQYGNRLKIISRLASGRRGRWLVPVLIFLFAYTFLPDDIIFIVLGTIRYSLPIALVAGVVGKASMLYTIGLFGSFIGESTSTLPDWVPIALSIVLFLGFLAVVRFVDWESILDRYSGDVGESAK